MSCTADDDCVSAKKPQKKIDKNNNSRTARQTTTAPTTILTKVTKKRPIHSMPCIDPYQYRPTCMVTPLLETNKKINIFVVFKQKEKQQIKGKNNFKEQIQ